MSDVILSAGVRQNLLALQSTAQLMSVTQNRLATGKKINSALDNPINFFTASGLQTRAGDLGALLDAMSNGVQTIQAANNGLTAMTTVVQQMQATVQQANQDSSFQNADFTIGTIDTSAVQQLTFTGGNLSSPVSVDLNTQDSAPGAGDGVVKTVDQLVTAINTDASLTGKVKAYNDNGQLRITNLSTADLTLTGANSSDVITGVNTDTQTIGGNIVRGNLATQFNNLINQLNSIAGDASYNGINLLVGDTLKLVFNETNTSSISITSQDPSGVNATTLGITAATGVEFSSGTQLSNRLTQLQNALTRLRSQSADLGSNLSLVENRQNFTKNMINTLKTGSDTLVLADTNEEGANMLALQTRQQLSITALSLSAQADQAILKIL